MGPDLNPNPEVAAESLPMTAGYAAICAEADRVGWPTHWRNDLLVHDRVALCGGRPDLEPITRFVWVLRELGTHLLLPDTKREEDQGSSRCWLRGIRNTWGDCDQQRARYYVWSCGKLREVDYEHARRMLWPDPSSYGPDRRALLRSVR